MDAEDLRAKAYRLGNEYERRYHGCGQCHAAAVLDTLGISDGALFKALTGFAAGIGLQGDSSCGAYAAGVLVLGALTGRPRTDFADLQNRRHRTYALAKRYHDQFIQAYGSVNCRDIQMKLFGRPYYIQDQDDRRKFEEAGAHHVHCPDVVGKGAHWLVDLVLSEGLPLSELVESGPSTQLDDRTQESRDSRCSDRPGTDLPATDARL